jgi:hypothetical protein
LFSGKIIEVCAPNLVCPGAVARQILEVSGWPVAMLDMKPLDAFTLKSGH